MRPLLLARVANVNGTAALIFACCLLGGGNAAFAGWEVDGASADAGSYSQSL